MANLQGVDVALRAVEPDDVDFLFLLESDPAAANTPAPVSRKMIWDYVQSYSADIFAEKQLRLIITCRRTGDAIGAVDIYDFDAANQRGFIGIAIAPQWRDKGYATGALDIICRYAAQTLGMHQLAAIVAVDNEPSKALFVGAGFRPAGKLRSWLRSGAGSYTDALFFQRLF